MSEPTREQKRTAMLRKVLPLYETIGLDVESLDGEVRCCVPLTPHNSNHFGVMHAGVLFSLAEATAALAFSLQKPFRGMLVIAKQVDLRFRRPATTAVTGRATLSQADADMLAKRLSEDPKSDWTIATTLVDAAGEVVADADATFVLRQPRGGE